MDVTFFHALEMYAFLACDIMCLSAQWLDGLLTEVLTMLKSEDSFSHKKIANCIHREVYVHADDIFSQEFLK
jgi:hypothetical protein